jgi:hypothetical protein
LVVGLAIGVRGATRRRIIIAGLVFLPGLMTTLITTQRLPALAALADLGGGVAAGFVVCGRSPKLATLVASLRRLVLGGLAVTALVAGVVLLQMVRHSQQEGITADRFGSVLGELQPWAGGYLPGFSIWYTEDMRSDLLHDHAWTHSMEGVLRIVGLGRHAPPRHMPIYLGNGRESTNAITAGRAFIYDFSVYGTWVLMLILGALSALLFRAAKRAGPVGAIGMSGVYASIVWSINYVLTAYGSQVLGYILALGLLLIAQRPLSKCKTRDGGAQVVIGATSDT